MSRVEVARTALRKQLVVLARHVDEITTVDEAERLSALFSDVWAEINADPCKVCHEPVRQHTPHHLLNGDLYHTRCLEALDVAPELG